MNQHEKIQPLLAAYESGMLSEEQIKDVEVHIQECDLCFEDLYEFAPVAQEIQKKRMQPRILRKPQRKIYPYLMAAVVMLAVAVGLWIFRSNTTTPETPILRGSDAITLQSPKENDLAPSPVLFRWQDRTNADEYFLFVYNEQGSLVHQEKLRTLEYQWHPKSPAGIYRWKVESYLSDGTRTSSSKIAEFRLK